MQNNLRGAHRINAFAAFSKPACRAGAVIAFSIFVQYSSLMSRFVFGKDPE